MSEWWQSAVFYQIYPKSFADSNGDGFGDLAGITSRMDYLADLGVDALWLSPFYRSPMADGGYDVSDPCDVDPMFGTLDDFFALEAAAKRRGIKLTVDIVPNHVSEQHPWFTEALAAAPGSPERERFIFRDGRGHDGSQPPNNWPSMFGGPAWTRVRDGQWYLHIFAPEQPDVNWDNPVVRDYFADVVRFWLSKGVDGLRIDVAHGMAKPDGLPDINLKSGEEFTGVFHQWHEDLRFDNDEVHELHRMFRRVLDEFPGTMAVGEVWVDDDRRLARYVRPDELHLVFNFELVRAKWRAESMQSAIDRSIVAMNEVGAPCTWVLSNHDVRRVATRYGGGAAGVRKARAAALVQLSLPGAAYIYNGEELGLENVDLPDEALQDPTWFRSNHTERGRDGERVPVPWTGDAPPYGFSTTEKTWLPMPEDWKHRTVEYQASDPGSTLSLYANTLRLRASLPELHSRDFVWQKAPSGCLAYRRGESLVVVVNLSDDTVALPAGEVVLSSSTLTGDGLPPHTTVWLRA